MRDTAVIFLARVVLSGLFVVIDEILFVVRCSLFTVHCAVLEICGVFMSVRRCGFATGGLEIPVRTT